LMVPSDATPAQRGVAFGASQALIFLGFFVYDVLWKSPLAKNEPAGAIISLMLFAAMALGLSRVMAGRALWLHLARQRLRQDDSDDFAAHAALADSTRWPEPIVRYLRGGFGADSLRALAAAAEVAGQGPRCAVSFYLGEEALLGGQTDSARSLFEETRTTCPKELHEHRAAVAELQRIARSPVLTERSDSTGTSSAKSR